ncbi:MAG: hypothetical protein AAF913_11520 [Pseudomonadota bacterium]
MPVAALRVEVCTADAITAGRLPCSPTPVFGADTYGVAGVIGERVRAEGVPVTYVSPEDSVATSVGTTLERWRTSACPWSKAQAAPSVVVGIGFNGRGVAMATAMSAIVADWANGCPVAERNVPIFAARVILIRRLRGLGLGTSVAAFRLLDRVGI